MGRVTRDLLLLLSFTFFLQACAGASLSSQEKAQVDKVSAASFLGHELTVDVAARTLLSKNSARLDVSAWKVDEAMRAFLRDGVAARGKEYRALTLDEESLKKALGARETRWKRVRGKYNQALLELVLHEAARVGAQYLFLVYPLESLERFPLHAGPLGVYCNDRGDKDARAYAYFEFDFSLWDVGARQKIFQGTVDPGVTESLSFASCEAAAKLPEPVRQLEEPTKRTMGLLVDALFEKMGWAKAP